MNVSFVITYHYSSLRKHGKKYLEQLLNSIVKSIDSKYKTKIYIIDNSSESRFDLNIVNKSNYVEYIYKYIEDQSIGGLTWAWNYGIKLAIEDGADILINLNDDLIINKSINNFINIINKHPNKNISLFGPVTNHGGAPEHQVFKNSNEIIETTGISYGNKEKTDYFGGHPLNGYALGFTKEMYNKYNIDGWLFSRDKRDMWGGQEDEFYIRNKPKGLKSYVVHSCFISHFKAYTWKAAREIFNHPKRTTVNYDSLIQLAPCYK